MVKFSLLFDRHQPTMSWPTTNLLYLHRQVWRHLLLDLHSLLNCCSSSPPWGRKEVNFSSCYESSVGFRLRLRGLGSTYLSFCLTSCSLPARFHVQLILLSCLLLAIFGPCIVYGFLLGVCSFSPALVFYVLSPFYGLFAGGAILFCFIICLISLLVLLFHSLFRLV